RTAYMAAVMLLLLTVTATTAAALNGISLGDPRGPMGWIVLGTFLVLAGGALLRWVTPLTVPAFPIAALSLALAWRYGPRVGALTALFPPACVAIVFSAEPATLVPLLAGGLAGVATLARRARRSASAWAVLYAGAPVALVAALACQAVRAWLRHPQSLES